MNDLEKIIYTAFVDYFVLLKEVERGMCGWDEDSKDKAVDILDDLMDKYALYLKNKVE